MTNFGTKFATSRPNHLTSIAVINLRQEKVKSLHTFMEKFGKLTLNIYNPSLEVAMHHMVTELKSNPFSNNLCKKPTTNRVGVAQYQNDDQIIEYTS